MLKINQTEGFDCPGCAWPEAPDRSHLEFCENGAKAVAEEATRRRIDDGVLRGALDHRAARTLRLLARQAGPPHSTGLQGARRRPLPPDRMGRRLPRRRDGAATQRSTPIERCSTRRDARATRPRSSTSCSCAGSEPTTFPTARTCATSRAASRSAQTVGLGKGTVSLEDVHAADLIFVVGQNPGTNHPRMLSALETAKQRGARIIAVNPLPEAGLMRFKNPQRLRGVSAAARAMADLFLQVKVGGDLALFTLLEPRGSIDAGAVDRRTSSPSTATGSTSSPRTCARVDRDALLAATGLDRRRGRRGRPRCSSARQRTIICWAMGLTQHKDAVPTIREVVNTLLLRGSLGRPGAGLCPVRGPQQRAGRPHDGHLREAGGRVPRRARSASSASTPPREHGLRHRRSDPRDARRRRSTCSSGWAATS